MTGMDLGVGEARAVAVIRSVLGDTRPAEIRQGAGILWINCPFCSSPVYMGDPPPEHQEAARSGLVGTHGICASGWCCANPKCPVDDARLARGLEHLRELEDQTRQRNLALSLERIRQEQAEAARRFEEGSVECQKRGACIRCWRLTRRFVKHRAHCPRRIG